LYKSVTNIQSIN